MLSRKPVIAAFALYALATAHAFAGDYTVSYAFDGGDINDSGTVHRCRYARSCVITSDKLDLSIMVDVLLPRKGPYKKLSVSVYGGRSRPDCCFFSDGVGSVDVDLENTFMPLGVYEGRARKRNEFVRNSPLGILYLQFTDMN